MANIEAYQHAIADIRDYADPDEGGMQDQYCGCCIATTIFAILERHGV